MISCNPVATTFTKFDPERAQIRDTTTWSKNDTAFSLTKFTGISHLQMARRHRDTAWWRNTLFLLAMREVIFESLRNDKSHGRRRATVAMYSGCR